MAAEGEHPRYGSAIGMGVQGRNQCRHTARLDQCIIVAQQQQRMSCRSYADVCAACKAQIGGQADEAHIRRVLPRPRARLIAGGIVHKD